MIREEIENKLKKTVAELLSIDETDVQENSSFVNDLNADSLDAVELVMNTEDEFNIDITDKEAEQAVNFKLLVDLVERKLNQ
jgi:acyl carrier protein